MDAQDKIGRRKFLSTTAVIVGGATALKGTPTPLRTDVPLPEGIRPGDPLGQYWDKDVSNVAHVTPPPEVLFDVVKERHRVFSFLLMALIVRFWNGNNNGPVGIYPQREGQKIPGQSPHADSFRYKGDLNDTDDPQRISWDRYLGHNIACLAVDGKGEVIDFDFNHNSIFRSSAEHAESRIVRRLFSLTDLADNWKVGRPISGKSRAFALKDVTIYTSLESCAQCSGVMSLGRVKQVVYLQNDPGAYRIGNIIYNLAGREDSEDGDGSALAALPIPASEISLSCLSDLNGKYEQFRSEMSDAKERQDATRAYFLLRRGALPVFTPSITSFLCTDSALEVFRSGARQFRSMTIKNDDETSPSEGDVWSNQKCLEQARRFFDYADVEGFRGSPHKL